MYWLVIVLVFAIFVYFIVSYNISNDIYNALFKRRNIEISGKEFKKYNDEVLKSFIENENYYYRETNSDIMVVIIHSFQSDSIKDSFNYVPFLLKTNYSLLLLNLPKSEYLVLDSDTYIKLAMQIEAIAENKKIVFFGKGLGAYISIKLSQMIPTNGIILDSLFISLKELLYFNLKLKKIPTFPTMKFIRKQIKNNSFFDIEEDDLEEKIKKFSISALLIHGENDNFCNVNYTKRVNQYLEKNSVMHIFSNTNHYETYMKNKNKYEKIVIDFIERKRRK